MTLTTQEAEADPTGAEGIEIVGTDAEMFRAYLEEDDPCFGRGYQPRNRACQACTAPVVYRGTLYLLRELCEARCQGADDPGTLRRLTSREVLDKLEAGASVEEIYKMILDGADPRVAAQKARSLLARRMRYIEQKWELPTPAVPPTAELTPEEE